MLKRLNIARAFSRLSHDVGIDLGTANTLVYVRGHGIVINEPSIVALNRKTRRIVAVGHDAKSMVGRAPAHIEIVQPLVDGVISDFEITEEMLRYLISRAQHIGRRPLRPRVVVGIPSGITNVEIRAVYDAAKQAGAREVHLIEEPMATAIGIRLPVMEPLGSMVVDIGGGTTDIAAISLGGIVQSKNLVVAGDRFNRDIKSYLRNEFKILVGDKTVEELKINLASAVAGEPRERHVKGRDLITGLPREIIVTDADVREAMMPSLAILLDGTKEVLETTPPDILGDIMQRGIFIGGGGALIKGLDILFENEFKLPVYVADDPLSAVARGCGIVLEEAPKFNEVLISDTDALPPR